MKETERWKVWGDRRFKGADTGCKARIVDLSCELCEFCGTTTFTQLRQNVKRVSLSTQISGSVALRINDRVFVNFVS